MMADPTTDIEPPSARRTAAPQISTTGCDAAVAALLSRAAVHTLVREKRRRGNLAIAVVGDAEMRRQHARWMDDDTTTDVLTFDLREDDDESRVDGQLIVCRSVGRRAAARRGHDWRRELALYVVHGCLHLCGYDDCDEADARRMHRREDELLSELGLGRVFACSGNTNLEKRKTPARRGRLRPPARIEQTAKRARRAPKARPGRRGAGRK